MKIFEIADMFPGQLMEIVYDLRRDGCTQGTDFDFQYIPPTYDYIKSEGTPRLAIFTFHTDKWATWFALKYMVDYDRT